jgi:hypothetical protein
MAWWFKMNVKTVKDTIKWVVLDKSNPLSYPIGFFNVLNEESVMMYHDHHDDIWYNTTDHSVMKAPVAWSEVLFFKGTKK